MALRHLSYCRSDIILMFVWACESGGWWPHWNIDSNIVNLFDVLIVVLFTVLCLECRAGRYLDYLLIFVVNDALSLFTWNLLESLNFLLHLRHRSLSALVQVPNNLLTMLQIPYFLKLFVNLGSQICRFAVSHWRTVSFFDFCPLLLWFIFLLLNDYSVQIPFSSLVFLVANYLRLFLIFNLTAAETTRHLQSWLVDECPNTIQLHPQFLRGILQPHQFDHDIVPYTVGYGLMLHTHELALKKATELLNNLYVFFESTEAVNIHIR